MTIKFLIIIFIGVMISCRPDSIIKHKVEKSPLKSIILGNENFLHHYLGLVKGKRVGLLTNQSGVNSKLESTSEILFKNDKVNLTTLFSPEHGIRGAVYAGDLVSNMRDEKTGLPVISLYGESRKPPTEMLKEIDMILVDLQDIGLRAYTYIYTMALMMKAAAENGIQVIILDRPNPIGGIRIEGNLIQKDFFSFVGMYPIPYLHGMTIGELALLFNSEYDINCNLDVITMTGWKRHMFWDQTGLTWIPTSPHVPRWQTIFYMGATGTIGELGVLSEGVGYTLPFEIVGAPWVNGEDYSNHLNKLNLPGVYFRPLIFKPYYARFAGQLCQGVQLHITDPASFQPYSTGLYLLKVHMALYPEKDLFGKINRVKMFNKVVGTDKIQHALTDNLPVEEIVKSWTSDLNDFKKIREKYLLYQ